MWDCSMLRFRLQYESSVRLMDVFVAFLLGLYLIYMMTVRYLQWHATSPTPAMDTLPLYFQDSSEESSADEAETATGRSRRLSHRKDG